MSRPNYSGSGLKRIGPLPALNHFAKMYVLGGGRVRARARVSSTFRYSARSCRSDHTKTVWLTSNGSVEGRGGARRCGDLADFDH